MSQPVPQPARRPCPMTFANFEPELASDTRDMCDIWLADICAAGWASREAHRVAAFLAQFLYTGRENDLYMRDLESGINIQPEESQRALKLLKLFGAIEDFQNDRGRLTVQFRVTLGQRVRLLETRARLAQLTQTSRDAALAAGIAALRAVSAQDNQDLDALCAATG